MQPIPITPAPVDDASPFSPFVLIMFALAAIATVTFIVVFFRKRTGERRGDAAIVTLQIALPVTIFGLAAGLMVATTAPTAAVLSKAQSLADAADVQTATVQTEIQKDYGLKLNTDEAATLRYPEKAPKEDFKIYGQLQKVGKGSKLQLPSDSVYLIWKDGALQLAEGSGKNFTELQQRG